MTEEVQQLENTSNASANASLLSPGAQVMDVVKTKVDNKKEKFKPMTKVVIRRLPPTMTQSQFIEQVSPLPEHDYFHFVKADMSLGHNAFSRAYINFLEQHDIFLFREKFDNYVFVDSKGTEYPAVVEFAPFQRLPKKRIGKKKDPKCGTIESDPYYINFLESLKNQDAESGTSHPKTEYSYQPFDNAQKRVTTTPLLEYLKQRKAEKQRLRDEKREERRRRDIERKKTKDEPTISKVLRNPDADREINRENKENKDEKEKLFQKETKNRKREDLKTKDKVLVARERDTKSTSKSYRDRDERKHERENKHTRKHEDKKMYNRREEKEDYSKVNRDDRRESKENGNTHNPRERAHEEKRGKSYEKMRQEKKRLAEAKKHGNVAEENLDIQSEKTKKDHIETKKNDTDNLEDISMTQKNKSVIHESDTKATKGDSHNSCVKNSTESDTEVNLINEMSQFVKGSIDFNAAGDTDAMKKMKSSKIVKRRSSLESGGEGGGGDGSHLRRHKSLDGGDQDNLQKTDDKEKDKKDPRLERRIRNKDRPAMEIYRPGMGRFSKQRLEREKSTHDDRASLSQSPTPLGKPIIAKNNDNSSNQTAAELRSMTFKRSISRDTS